MVLENNPVNKNIVRALRAVVFLLCIFKGFYSADGYYNSIGSLMNIQMDGVWFYVALIIGLGVFNFLFTMLASTLSFTSMTRSKWAPINERGVCKVNYCTFHTNFAISVSIGYLVQGALGLVIYFYPISSALLSQVLMRVASFIIVAFVNILMMITVDKKERKNLFISLLMCNILTILLLG